MVDPDAKKGGAVDCGPLVYGSTNHGKLSADEYKKQYRVRLHQWGSSSHACVLPEKIWRFNAARPRRSAGSGSHFMAETADSAIVVGGSLLKVRARTDANRGGCTCVGFVVRRALRLSPPSSRLNPCSFRHVQSKKVDELDRSFDSYRPETTPSKTNRFISTKSPLIKKPPKQGAKSRPTPQSWQAVNTYRDMQTRRTRLLSASERAGPELVIGTQRKGTSFADNRQFRSPGKDASRVRGLVAALTK